MEFCRLKSAGRGIGAKFSWQMPSATRGTSDNPKPLAPSTHWSFHQLKWSSWILRPVECGLPLMIGWQPVVKATSDNVIRPSKTGHSFSSPSIVASLPDLQHRAEGAMRSRRTYRPRARTVRATIHAPRFTTAPSPHPSRCCCGPSLRRTPSTSRCRRRCLRTTDRSSRHPRWWWRLTKRCRSSRRRW